MAANAHMYDYVPLKDLVPQSKANLYGVVKEVVRAAWTNGQNNSYTVVLELTDPSLCDLVTHQMGSVRCTLNASTVEQIPPVRGPGDILRLHRVKIKELPTQHNTEQKLQIIGATSICGGSFLVFDGTQGESMEPRGDAKTLPKTITWEKADEQMLKKLRKFISRWPELSPQPGVAPAVASTSGADGKSPQKERSALSTVQLRDICPMTYVDCLGQVVGVFSKGQTACRILRIWDGTRLRPQSSRLCNIPEDLEEWLYDEALNSFLLEKDLNYIADVFVYDNFVESVKDTQPGDIVLLKNLHSFLPKKTTRDAFECGLTMHGTRPGVERYNRSITVMPKDDPNAVELLRGLSAFGPMPQPHIVKGSVLPRDADTEQQGPSNSDATTTAEDVSVDSRPAATSLPTSEMRTPEGMPSIAAVFKASGSAESGASFCSAKSVFSSASAVEYCTAPTPATAPLEVNGDSEPVLGGSSSPNTPTTARSNAAQNLPSSATPPYPDPHFTMPVGLASVQTSASISVWAAAAASSSDSPAKAAISYKRKGKRQTPQSDFKIRKTTVETTTETTRRRRSSDSGNAPSSSRANTRSAAAQKLRNGTDNAEDTFSESQTPECSRNLRQRRVNRELSYDVYGPGAKMVGLSEFLGGDSSPDTVTPRKNITVNLTESSERETESIQIIDNFEIDDAPLVSQESYTARTQPGPVVVIRPLNMNQLQFSPSGSVMLNCQAIQHQASSPENTVNGHNNSSLMFEETTSPTRRLRSANCLVTAAALHNLKADAEHVVKLVVKYCSPPLRDINDTRLLFRWYCDQCSFVEKVTDIDELIKVENAPSATPVCNNCRLSLRNAAVPKHRLSVRLAFVVQDEDGTEAVLEVIDRVAEEILGFTTAEVWQQVIVDQKIFAELNENLLQTASKPMPFSARIKVRTIPVADGTSKKAFYFLGFSDS